MLLECLEQSRRVVIPAFGAFVRSQIDDKVVFTALLTRDDGALVAELRRRGAVDATQAHREIAEYIKQIKVGVAAIGEYLIEGLGALYADEHEIFRLEYDPQQMAKGDEPPHAKQPAPGLSDWKKSLPDIYAKAIVREKTVPAKPQPAPVDAPALQPEPQAARDQQATTSTTVPASDPKSAAADGKLPDLQYQKPEQPVSVFEHTGEKRRADTIMIIAIIAAAIAIGAMLYGLLRSPEPIVDLKNNGVVMVDGR
ncbi:hypothetical protein FACS1894159_05040 [Bacteroidia bacterium]|nr:hypothetical protein FACS1894159_05040 [Bacteroidia bacterium]